MRFFVVYRPEQDSALAYLEIARKPDGSRTYLSFRGEKVDVMPGEEAVFLHHIVGREAWEAAQQYPPPGRGL